MALTRPQLAFIDKYFECGLRGPDAARVLGRPDPRMYSHRMLTNDNVLAEIDQRLAKKRITSNMVLSRLSDMAMSNIADFAGIEDTKDLRKYRHKTHVIKKFKKHSVTRYDEKGNATITIDLELELYGADVALVNIGRHYKLFTDNFKIEDWRTELLDALKSGKVKPEEVPSILGDNDLAAEFIQSAGLQFAGIREAQAQGVEVE